MVIDVVGSLFDQILSDPKVPPQMARQIARLQLPVLRVALGDVTFFSSRRHPVRRFVNRIASLACAFDDFDEDPGAQFLKLVRDLVQDIVSGDFDQMEVYEGKLADLEAFIAEQTQAEVERAAGGGAPALFDTKEDELRLQQRYMHQLQLALAPVAMPDFMREFLTQVWSQTIVLAVRKGSDPNAGTRMRRAARDLVMSIQPKGAPPQRKAFLLGLPQLMKDLNEGLSLVGWPDAARKDFFGKLLPAHAESLKGSVMRELDHNLLVKQLEGIFNAALPRPEDLRRSDMLPVLHDIVPERQFTAEEAKQVGLVEESAVDWDGTVDIEVGVEPELTESDIDINIDGLPPAEAAGPDARLRAGRPCADRLRLSDAPERELAEGAALLCQPRTRILRVHARQEASADDLDDRPHAGAHVRHRPAARVRERLPDRARDGAGAQATGRARPSTPPGEGALRRLAIPIAAIRLAGSARAEPAMSNAVPWSGLVRTNGRPSVTLTPCSTPRYFTGMRPWSCVIATTMSNSPRRARMKTVSGA